MGLIGENELVLFILAKLISASVGTKIKSHSHLSLIIIKVLVKDAIISIFLWHLWRCVLWLGNISLFFRKKKYIFHLEMDVFLRTGGLY